MVIYLIIFNMIGFSLMYYDKRLAQQHKFRISESTLFACSLLGGFIGMMIMGQLIRHKTRKISFKVVYLISIVIWVIIVLKFKLQII